MKKVVDITNIKTHGLVRGKIEDFTNEYASIKIGDRYGVLLKPDYVPKEIKFYTKGIQLVFFVKIFSKSTQSIILSRASKSLPELLLKEMFPEYQFKSIKRIIGVKSVIKTTLPATLVPDIKNELRSVRGELFHEFIEFKPMA